MALTIIVDSRVRLYLEELGEPLAADLRQKFTHTNPQFVLKKVMGIPAWGEPPVYRTWEHDEGGKLISFPRGGMGRVRAALTASGKGHQIQDRRTTGKVVKAGFIPPTKMLLRGYQTDMLGAALRRENCLLRAGTGSGKTTVAIALASRVGLYTLVIVWSAGLFDQWVERIERELGIPEADIGIIRGSKTKIRPITVAMQQTLAARGADDLPLDVFGAVICDEVQRFAAKTLFEAVDIWPAKYRIGISADESRKDKKEFLIYDLFGDVAADIKRDDLIEEGSVLDVEIRVIPTEFKAPWYQQTRDFNQLLDEMANDKEREDLLDSVVQEILAEGEQLFVLSHRRVHCERIIERQAGVKTGLLVGEKTKADREEFIRTKRGMELGVIKCGVGTIQAIAQGLDIQRIGRMLVGTPMAANRQLFGQGRGRVCRTFPGKKDAALYYLWDRHVYGLKHLENLLAWNNQVIVKRGVEWIPGREYLKEARADEKRAAATAFDF